MEFLEFRFNNTVGGNEIEHSVRLVGQLIINKVEKFNYLGLVV